MRDEAKRDTASVLVIDDYGIGKLFRYNLEDESTRIIDVCTGADGIRTLYETKIDLLLLDLGLPDMDGRVVLNQLKNTYSLNHLPVIVVSDEPPDERLIQQYKLRDYIQKPFDMRDLIPRVKRAITDTIPINYSA